MTDQTCRNCAHARWDEKRPLIGVCKATVTLSPVPVSWDRMRWTMDAMEHVRWANDDGVMIERDKPCTGCPCWSRIV